jgi:hypothetical protein
MTANSPLTLPEEFNAASYFVDRHMAEGRGQRVAIEWSLRPMIADGIA